MTRYLKYTITQGETLQSIAQKTVSDISKWQDIADYNNLEYPYVVDSPADKVSNPSHLATLGDTIILPFPVDLLNISPTRLNQQDQQEIERLALGSDLKVNIFGQGSWDGIYRLTAENGDLALVTGVDNVAQAIVSRLMTAKGSLDGHPDFGSDIETEIGSGFPNVEQEITNDISKAILSDARVDDATCNSSTITGSEYSSSWTVTLESLTTEYDWLISRDSSGNFTIS